MPNVSKLSPYLSASDVKDGDVLTFSDCGELLEKDFQGEAKTVLEIGVEVNGIKKLYTPNGTSYKKIAEKLGPDTEEWVGKQAKLAVVKMNIAGNMKSVLYAEAV